MTVPPLSFVYFSITDMFLVHQEYFWTGHCERTPRNWVLKWLENEKQAKYCLFPSEECIVCVSWIELGYTNWVYSWHFSPHHDAENVHLTGSISRYQTHQRIQPLQQKTRLIQHLWWMSTTSKTSGFIKIRQWDSSPVTLPLNQP